MSVDVCFTLLRACGLKDGLLRLGRTPTSKTFWRSLFMLKSLMHLLVVAGILGFSGIASEQASFQVLHLFADSPDGADSHSTLVEAGDGSFYGTTARGGH